MADDTRVAKRYAAALYDVAVKDNTVQAVASDLVLVERFLAEVPYLNAMVMHPLASDDRKRKVLSDAFGDRTTATTLNFLYLLVRKRRETTLANVIREFRRLVDEQLQRVVAQVHTAQPLTTGQLSALKTALSQRTGKNVEIEAFVDPDVIGGMRILLGDNIIDGTVRGRLERMRLQLLGVA